MFNNHNKRDSRTNSNGNLASKFSGLGSNTNLRSNARQGSEIFADKRQSGPTPDLLDEQDFADSDLVGAEESKLSVQSKFNFAAAYLESNDVPSGITNGGN